METTLAKRETAYATHSRIMANGQIAAQALAQVCRDLKTMRDDKLYLEMGYETFDDYVQDAVGLKKRQAYAYIAAYERLGAQFIEEHATAGITKLELISQIDSVEREELLEAHDMEDTSVRELKELVEQYKKRIEQLTLDLGEAQAAEAPQPEPDTAELDEAYSRIEALTAQLQEKERQQTVQVVTDEHAVRIAVEEAEKKKDEEIRAVKKEKREAVKMAEEKARQASAEELQKAKAEIEKLKAAAASREEKLQAAEKKAKAAGADADMVRLKFLFAELQSTANETAEAVQKLKSKGHENAAQLASGIAATLRAAADRMEA